MRDHHGLDAHPSRRSAGEDASEGNLNGFIFGGWILAQMDKAAGLLAMALRRSVLDRRHRQADLRNPLRVGADFRIYGEVAGIGRTSMQLRLTCWDAGPLLAAPVMAVEGTFICVAIDANGRPRPVDPC